MLTSWDDDVCRAPDSHHSMSYRRRNMRHGITAVLLGVLALLLVPRASAQSRDDFSYWDANGNGDLTCTEAQGRDEGLRLPAYQDDRDGTGIIYEWLERTRSSDTDNDGIGCDSASNPNGYIPNVQPKPPVDPQGCLADAVTWRGLKVCDERPRDGYDRDAFGTGYSSLEDDIIAALPPSMKTNGKVYTPYSCILFDITTNGTAATDIEHIVALAEAHDSGIDDNRRRDIASDLDNLTIADPTVNRSQKGDRDAAEWMPARHGAWFAERVIQVKMEYGLSVDSAERDSLEALLAGGGAQLNCVAADESTPTMLTLAAVPVPAEGGEPVTVTATLDNPAPAEGTTVTLTASGTATSADYVLSSTTITIAEGETTGTATITISDDAEDDDGETIVLDAESTNPALTAPPLTLTIEDNDAVPVLAGGPTYYFPHLAVGDKYQTTITYINYSSEEVTCQTDFLSDQGTPLMVSFADRGTVMSRIDVLDPGGSVHQETNAELSAPLAPGWARATCSGPVKASLLFRLHDSAGMPVAEAGVNAATVPATRFVTFAEQGEGQPGTGVAYANPSDTEAVISFTARDSDGETLASVNQELSAGGHGAQNMAPLFGLSSFTGSLEVTSTAPIVTLSINAEAAPVFSSLPPGELDVAAQGSTTYYFPHLAVGDKYQTTITYINYSPQEVTCQTDFISDHGSPLLVSFADRVTGVDRTDVLPPGGSVHQETDMELSAPLAPGWARATCTGPVKASLLFRLHDSAGMPVAEAGVNAATVPATRFVTFAEQGEGQPGTGVAYANPSDTSALVTFTARAADGEMLASVDKPLLPNGHGAQNMEPLFGLSSFTGSLEVTSTEPIVSLSINAEAAPVFSSLPSGELDAAPDVPGVIPMSGAPDLVVQTPSVSDSTPNAGESFTLSAAVRNQGNGRSASTTLRYYRSSDETISTGDTEVGTDAVSALAPAGTSNGSISLTAPSTAGTYYFGACVDPVSGESATGNNCSDSRVVTVRSGSNPQIYNDNVFVLPVADNLTALWTDFGKSPPLEDYAARFYEHFNDEFDFLIFFPNVDLDRLVPGSINGAFYHSVKNDVQGIGLSMFSHNSSFGSAGKLQGVIFHNYDDPSSFRGTLLHELMHRWGNFVVPITSSPGGPHWGFSSSGGYLDCYDISNIIDHGGGKFSAPNPFYFRSSEQYSPIELYLAGFIPPEEVPDFQIAEDGEWLLDERMYPVEDDNGYRMFTASGFKTHRIEDIIAEHGPRVPDHSQAQKDFRAAVILLISEDYPATRERLERLSDDVFWFSHAGKDESGPPVTNFYEATGGRGTITIGGLSQFQSRARAKRLAPSSFGTPPPPIVDIRE